MNELPADASYDHKIEFKIMNKINTCSLDSNFLASRPHDKYAIDINIYDFDFGNLTGKRLCGVEVENNGEQYPFINYPITPQGWKTWSFLARKVDDKVDFHYQNKDEDVYLLCDYNNYDNIYWSTFGKIRELCCRMDNGSRKTNYYRLPIGDDKEKDLIFMGYDRLNDYFKHLRKKNDA